MVRILTAMTAAMLSASVAAAPGVEPAQQQIRQVVADISPQRIGAHVRKLVGFQTRHTMSDTVSDTCGIARPTEIVNVVATLPGSQPQSAGRIYVVSGHYDSRATDVMAAQDVGNVSVATYPMPLR